MRDIKSQSTEELKAYSEEVEQALQNALDFACPYCKAKIGKDCKRGFKRANHMHVQRLNRMHDANKEIYSARTAIAYELKERRIKEDIKQREEQKKQEEIKKLQREQETLDKIISKLPTDSALRPSITLYFLQNDIYVVREAKNIMFPFPGKELPSWIVEKLLETNKLDICFEEKRGGQMQHEYYLWPHFNYQAPR